MTHQPERDPEDDPGASTDLSDLDLDRDLLDEDDDEDDDDTLCPDCGDPLDLLSGFCLNPHCPANE